LRIAAELIAAYSYKQPFHLWLQEIFRHHKQFGSKDRKFYRDVFYGYWRLGGFGTKLSAEQRLLAGLIRLQNDSVNYSDIIPEVYPGLGSSSGFGDIQEFTGEEWNPYKPYNAYLSANIKISKLNNWFGKKAPVWIKINPRFRQELFIWLKNKSLDFEEFDGGTLKIANENLDEAILKGWCRIQDLSSQESLNDEILSDAELVWDACCGAGGKALLACEINPEATLYISDSRSQSVHNALQRFSAEGKPLPFSGTTDLTTNTKALLFDDKISITKPVFDTIICDVPCSGSGTWRRNPEMISGFSADELSIYTKRQRKIVENALMFLKPGGKLIYLTCSVFSAENEENVHFFSDQKGLHEISEEYCGGYNKDADFIYRAVLRK